MYAVKHPRKYEKQKGATHQALEHGGVPPQLGACVLAVHLHVGGTVCEDPNVISVVALHRVLTLLELLFAFLTKVRLGHVLHQALHNTGLPRLGVLQCVEETKAS